MRLFKSFDTDDKKPQISSEPVPKSRTNYSFLVVDDSRFSRGILTDILKGEGYTIVGEASDGIEAIEMVKEKNPAFVFMDITMPKMDGLTAVKEILKINPDINIIMCSALSQKKVIVEAIKAGAKDFVIKPYKKENILHVVDIHMEAEKKGQVIPFRSENHIKKNKGNRYDLAEENEVMLSDEETLSKEIDLVFESYENETDKTQDEKLVQPKFKVVKPEKDEPENITEPDSDSAESQSIETKSVDSVLDEFERFLETFSTYSTGIIDTEQETETESTEETDPDDDDTILQMPDSDEVSADAESDNGSHPDTIYEEAPDVISEATNLELSGQSDVLPAEEPITDEIPADEEVYSEGISVDEGTVYADTISEGTADVLSDELSDGPDDEPEEEISASAADAVMEMEDETSSEPDQEDGSADLSDDTSDDISHDLSYNALEAMSDAKSEDMPISLSDDLLDFGLPKEILPNRPVHTYTNRFDSNTQSLELNHAKGIKVNRVAAARLIKSDVEDTPGDIPDMDSLYGITTAYVSLDSKPGKDETEWNQHMVTENVINVSSSVIIDKPATKSLSMLAIIRKEKAHKKHEKSSEILVKAITDLVSKKGGRIFGSE